MLDITRWREKKSSKNKYVKLEKFNCTNKFKFLNVFAEIRTINAFVVLHPYEPTVNPEL